MIWIQSSLDDHNSFNHFEAKPAITVLKFCSCWGKVFLPPLCLDLPKGSLQQICQTPAHNSTRTRTLQQDSVLSGYLVALLIAHQLETLEHFSLGSYFAGFCVSAISMKKPWNKVLAPKLVFIWDFQEQKLFELRRARSEKIRVMIVQRLKHWNPKNKLKFNGCRLRGSVLCSFWPILAGGNCSLGSFFKLKVSYKAPSENSKVPKKNWQKIYGRGYLQLGPLLRTDRPPPSIPRSTTHLSRAPLTTRTLGCFSSKF